MKFKRYISVICAAAVIAAASGCKSKEIQETSAATSAPGAVSVNPAPALHGEETSADTTELIQSPVLTTTSASDTENNATYTETSAPETNETTVVYYTSETTAAVTTTAPVTSEKKTDEVLFASDNDEFWFEFSDTIITTETEKTELYIYYIGNDPDALYTTGVDYRLEKLTGGKWTEQKFKEDTCWIAIAYEISEMSNAVIPIYLTGDMYAEPVTAGHYRVVKKISGKDYFIEFDINEYDGYVEDTDGTITLAIDEIKPDEFVCELATPYYYVYHVICDTSEYDDFCVGDFIDVDYKTLVSLTESEYRIIPKKISTSSFALDPDVCYKPVIYLYPTVPTEMSVKVDFSGRLTLTDPEYRDGWNVTAYPDGRLICDGKEYKYLFWEGENDFEMSRDEGFCVSGSETEKFLRDKLEYLGLNEKETEDFLEFWLPFMKNNNYNIITFVTDEYTDNAKLDISPSPDTVIRVYMLFTASDTPVDIPAQTLEQAPARTGTTVVEWGGGVY